MFACSAGAFECVKLLLKKGADINYTTNLKSPLLLSLMSSDLQCLEFLIDEGADLKLKGEEEHKVHIAINCAALGFLSALKKMDWQEIAQVKGKHGLNIWHHAMVKMI